MFDKIFDVIADAASEATDFALEVMKEEGPHIAHALCEIAKSAVMK